MPQRTWFRLGTTSLDMSPVVKIVFDAKDARLFVVSGESLLLTAWTEERGEIAKLKEYAGDGWVKVLTEPDDDVALDQRLRLGAVDKIVSVKGKLGARLELFIGGVYAGQVTEASAIEAVTKKLGGAQ